MKEHNKNKLATTTTTTIMQNNINYNDDNKRKRTCFIKNKDCGTYVVQGASYYVRQLKHNALQTKRTEPRKHVKTTTCPC